MIELVCYCFITNQGILFLFNDFNVFIKYVSWIPYVNFVSIPPIYFFHYLVNIEFFTN